MVSAKEFISKGERKKDATAVTTAQVAPDFPRVSGKAKKAPTIAAPKAPTDPFTVREKAEAKAVVRDTETFEVKIAGSEPGAPFDPQASAKAVGPKNADNMSTGKDEHIIHKSAVDGEIVSQDFADENPRETYALKVKNAPPPKKAAAKKAPAKKAATKQPAKKTAAKSATKKATKSVAKKAPAKKTAKKK